MRVSTASLFALLAGSNTGGAHAFSLTAESKNNVALASRRGAKLFQSTQQSNVDCGCASEDIIFGGEPSDRAKNLNHREAMRGINFFRVTGESVTMEDLLPEKGVSIVVALRSLG